MRLTTIAFKHFHVACIRRRTVKDLSSDPDFPHFFSEIGIFYSRQPVTTLTVGQPEIPQTSLFCLGFEPIYDFNLEIRQGKTIF